MAAAKLIETTDLSKEAIADKVGYPGPKAVDAALRLPQVSGYLAKHLDDAGATLEASARAIADGHKAEKITYFSFQGEVLDERTDVDHDTRLRSAELNLKARGELRDPGVSANIFLGMTDEQVAAIAAGTLDPASLIDVGPRINNPAGAKIENPPTP